MAIDPLALELEREMSVTIANCTWQLAELDAATHAVLEAVDASGADQEAAILRVVNCAAEVNDRYTKLGAVVVKLGEAITAAGQLSRQTLN
jgi:hypothetical protein